MKVTSSLGVVASLLVSGCFFCCTGCGQPGVPKPPTPPPATSKPMSATPAPAASAGATLTGSPSAVASAKPAKAATSAPVAVTGGAVTITLTDDGPEPQSLSVPAEKDFTIKVINKGKKPFGFKFEGDFGRRTTEIDKVAPGGSGELVMNLGPGAYTANQVTKDESELKNKAVTFESVSSGAPRPAAPSSPSASGAPVTGSPAASSPAKP